MKKFLLLLIVVSCVVSGCENATLDVAGKLRLRGEPRLLKTPGSQSGMPVGGFLEGNWNLNGTTDGDADAWFAGTTGGDYSQWFGGAGATGGDFGGEWFGDAGATGGDYNEMWFDGAGAGTTDGETFGDFDWDYAPGTTY